MTNLVKDRIETLGFHQTVVGDTRFWPFTENSLVDQCWTNCPARIIRASNKTRGSSDHNIQETIIRVAGTINDPREIILRDKRHLNWEEIKKEAGDIDWSNLLETDNLNAANNIFESEIRGILDAKAPIISRKIYMKNKIWISERCKDEMKVRDSAREKASRSQLPDDWDSYRRSKNLCTRLVKEDKRRHFEQTFKDVKTSGNCTQKSRNS